jgi:hypothetical protein
MNSSRQSVTLREFTGGRAAAVVATAGLDQSGTKMMRRERMRAGIRAIRARLTSQQQGRQAVPCRARLVGRFRVGRQKSFQAREGFQKAPLQGGVRREVGEGELMVRCSL